MRDRTAHKANGNPLRTLGLSVFFAGMLLVTSVANVAAMPVTHDAANTTSWIDPLPLRVDPVPLRVDPLPHQIAPVPLQVAPEEGLDDIVLASHIDPLTSGSQAWSDRLNAQAAALGSQTLRSDSGVPHQVAPFESQGTFLPVPRIAPPTSLGDSGVPHQVAPLER